MRQSTIHHINERIAHANQQHGEFTSADHIIAQARVELDEAQIAHWHGAGDVVHELLDAAVVCIRGAEQFGGLEGTEYDPAVVAFKPAVDPTDAEVEALAEVMRELLRSNSRTVFADLARAAYAHIGAEVAKLRAELERVRDCKDELLERREEQAGMLKEIKRLKHAYEVERDRANDLVAEAKHKRLRPVKVRSGISAYQLDLWMQKELNWSTTPEKAIKLIDYIHSHAVIEQPETRPVKVRFDVTAEEVWNTYLKSGESHETPLVDWILPHLAAHAVIDAPREWSVEDVEALAKVLYEAPDHHGDAMDWTVASQYWRKTSENEARAALQWMAERGATVQPSTALEEALAKIERQRNQLH